MTTPTIPDPKTLRSKWRLPFAPTFLIGLLLVPASALAANALVTSTPAAEAAANPTAGQLLKLNAAATESAPSADASAGSPAASSADLAAACGSEGLALVDKESTGTITELEKAALDALRDVCERAGMALPATTAPVGETLTLAAGGAAAVDAKYNAFVAAYSAAEASINSAIAANGDATLINQAIDMLGVAQQAAQQGDFVAGIDRATAAAQTAVRLSSPAPAANATTTTLMTTRVTRAASMTTTRGTGSSKRRLEILSLAMALTVTFTGALPLLWLVTRSDPVNQESNQQSVTAADPVSQSVSSFVLRPVVDTAGLTPTIVRVLESSGFARATGRTELEGQLAPAVLDVLIADGVVLTVPDTADQLPEIGVAN